MTIKTAIELEVKQPSLKGFRAELRQLTLEAQNAVVQFGEFSPEAQAAERRLAALRDRMEDFNDRVAAVNPDKFAQINTVVSSVARGFQAAQGAMALFGTESEDLQKTLVKLQGAMALAEGLEGLGKIQQQFGAIAGIIKDKLIVAFGSLRSAIISTGIGALAIGIGILIEKIISLKSEEEIAKEKLDLMTRSIESQTNATNKLNTELDKQIQYQLKLADAMGINAYEKYLIEAEGFAEKIKYVNETITKLETERDKAISISRSQFFSKSEKEREQEVENIKNVYNPQIIKLQNELSNYENELGLIGEKENKRQSDEKIKNAEDAKNKELQFDNELRAKKQANELALIESERLRLEKQSEFQKQNEIIRIKNTQYNTKQKNLLIEQEEIAHQKRLKDIATKSQKDLEKSLNEIHGKALEQRDDRQKQSNKFIEDSQKQIVINSEKLEQSTLQRAVMFTKANYAAILDLTEQGLEAILYLNESFSKKDEEGKKKQFENNKKLQIANAIISTLNSIVAIFSNAAKNPTTIPFPAYPYIQAGLAGVYGFANVQRIRNTQYSGGSSSAAAPSIGGGAPRMTTGSSLPTESAGGGKVYVLEGDITRAQQRVNGNQRVSTVE